MKLAVCMNQPVPIDLPKSADFTESTMPILEVSVDAYNQYLIDGQVHEIEVVKEIILRHLSSSDYLENKLKIRGDKKAYYEKIFELIAFCKTENIAPVLVYQQAE